MGAPQGSTPRQVAQHGIILDLLQRYDGWKLHCRQCLRDTLQLVPIAPRGPSARGRGQEFEVILAFVMTCVKHVLDIPCCNAQPLRRHRLAENQQGYGK